MRVHPGTAWVVATTSSPHDVDGSSARWTSCRTTTTPRCSPRTLAVHAGLRGTTANGTLTTRRNLHKLGVKLRGASIVDGSGLSLGDHLSARQILGDPAALGAAALGLLPARGAAPWRASAARSDDRMRSGPAHRERATPRPGTLDTASALSGYVTLGQRPPARVLDPPEPPAAPRRAGRPPAAGRASCSSWPGRASSVVTGSAARRSSSAEVDHRHAQRLGLRPLRAAALAGEHVVGRRRDRRRDLRAQARQVRRDRVAGVALERAGDDERLPAERPRGAGARFGPDIVSPAAASASTMARVLLVEEPRRDRSRRSPGRCPRPRRSARTSLPQGVHRAERTRQRLGGDPTPTCGIPRAKRTRSNGCDFERSIDVIDVLGRASPGTRRAGAAGRR